MSVGQTLRQPNVCSPNIVLMKCLSSKWVSTKCLLAKCCVEQMSVRQMSFNQMSVGQRLQWWNVCCPNIALTKCLLAKCCVEQKFVGQMFLTKIIRNNLEWVGVGVMPWCFLLNKVNKLFCQGLESNPGTFCFSFMYLNSSTEPLRLPKTRQIFFRTQKIIGRGLYSKTFYGHNLRIFMIG